MSLQELIHRIPVIAKAHGLKHCIICPGSRSAPLVLAFSRFADITCRVIVDERSAAFIALGIAQQTREPVGLVCTSGTALLNFYPAIAEAYYQQLPLIVFSGDRPTEWVDQNDGQTIRQTGALAQHTRASYELSTDIAHPDQVWHFDRLLNEAFLKAKTPSAGPVHLNVPFREPFYPKAKEALRFPDEVKTIQYQEAHTQISESEKELLIKAWQTAQKKIIVAGMPYRAWFAESGIAFPKDAVLLTDATANLHSHTTLIHYDFILGRLNQETLQTLQPDLLVTIGGPVVSKSLKKFLRAFPATNHWHVTHQPQQLIDPFQSITKIINVNPEQLIKLVSSNESNSNAYVDQWKQYQAAAESALQSFSTEGQKFSELAAMSHVFESLPQSTLLQVANSMPIRFVNLLGLIRKDIDIYANRGTSGIDGCVSTAVGAALAKPDRTVVLLTGDLAFFYDTNGLWHKEVPSNLRIIISNNEGGGIFRLIDGPSSLPELEPFFEVRQNQNAALIAQHFDLSYYFCSDWPTLKEAMASFLQPNNQAAILEIKTKPEENRSIFEAFKNLKI